MAEATQSKSSIRSVIEWFGTTLGQIVVAIIVPVITGYVMVKGFIFLRDGDAPKYVIALVAIIWGVGGVALIYYITNWLIEKLPPKWMARLQPFLFVDPVSLILGICKKAELADRVEVFVGVTEHLHAGLKGMRGSCPDDDFIDTIAVQVAAANRSSNGTVKEGKE